MQVLHDVPEMQVKKRRKSSKIFLNSIQHQELDAQLVSPSADAKPPSPHFAGGHEMAFPDFREYDARGDGPKGAHGGGGGGAHRWAGGT